ncbi:MAG TPA: hypothetical protein VIY48_22440 [Candidatus Paceibacterota bacterium]
MTASYSLYWAEEIYVAFHQSYPRATDWVEKFLGITPKAVVKLITFQSKPWRDFKRMVHSWACVFGVDGLEPRYPDLKHTDRMKMWADNVLSHCTVTKKEVLDKLNQMCSTGRAVNEGVSSEETSETPFLFPEEG